MKTMPGHGWLLCLCLLLGACTVSENRVPVTVESNTALGSLPAQFQGRLPCADCVGIHYELNLYPDRAYTLQTNYLGQGEELPTHFEMGHWQIGNSGDELELVPADHSAHSLWRILDADTLIMLDENGNERASGLPDKLYRTGRPQAASLENTHLAAAAPAGRTRRCPGVDPHAADHSAYRCGAHFRCDWLQSCHR
jgi:uncharacterized lipoprotein NlpE involved in copper resistance